MRVAGRLVVPSALLLGGALGLVAAGGLAAEEPKLELPRGFRSWAHVKSMAVEDRDHGMYGFHNVYANAKALKGLRAKAAPKRYEPGAAFVVSIYEVERKEGMVRAGKKRRDVVQLKDPAAKATGGWRFAAFDPSGKRVAINTGECFACHADAKAEDHVLVRYTD